MNFAILLTTIYIFLNNIGYIIYEYQNKNKLAGTSILILNIFMVIFVNYCILNFK